jgi:putative sterol carrier protein
MQERVAKNGGIAGKSVVFDFGDEARCASTAQPRRPAFPTTMVRQTAAVKVSMADFMEIAQGKQNAQMAFMMGKLKVEGDMSIALQLGKILG